MVIAGAAKISIRLIVPGNVKKVQFIAPERDDLDRAVDAADMRYAMDSNFGHASNEKVVLSAKQMLPVTCLSRQNNSAGKTSYEALILSLSNAPGLYVLGKVR